MKFLYLSLIFTLFSFLVKAQNFTDKIVVKKDQVVEIASTTSDIMNMGMEMSTNTTIIRKVKIAEVSESEIKLKIKITKIKSSGNAGGMAADYDSEKPDSENNPELIETFKDKLNAEDEFSVNRTTLISTDLTKKDSIGNGPMEAITDAVGGTDAVASEMFFLIPKGTKAGNSWSTTSETKTGKTENSYILKEVNEGFANVDFKTITSLNITFPYEGMEMKMNLRMKISGSIIVNTETGILKKKSTLIISEGSMNMMGQETPLTMNTTMKSTYTIK